MRLKVDESLNIGYTNKTVPWDIFFRDIVKKIQTPQVSFDCIVNNKFTNTAARITPMKSTPKVFPTSRCGRRSWVEEDIVD
jgi:hypothetical protein